MYTTQLTINARKGIALGLAVSTLLWAAMLWALPFTVSAAPHGDGCLINSSGTIYLITGGQQRGFPTAEVFNSHGYSFSQVVAASAEDTQAKGPVMVYADATLVKGPADPLVYLVANGQKRGFVSGAVFTGLGFSFANIVTAATNTFADLPTGANLESATERHTAGVLVNSAGTIWHMTATGRHGIATMEVFNSHGYKLANVVAANAADLAATNEGLLAARAACAAVGVTPPPPAGAVSVSLASDNPAAATIIAGQAIADLAHFQFNGTGKVTSMVLKRLGVSSDTTLAAVYLYDGVVRLSDSATVSSGTITFNNSAGLFTVSGSRKISVRSNIAASTSGQTAGVQLFSASADVGTVSGAPLSGNLHTVAAAPSNFATVAFATSTTPAASTISPQDDYTMWQNVVTVGNTKVRLLAFKLRQVGSVTTTDLKNFELFVDGTKVASVAALDADGYANFDLSAAPLTLETGSRTIKMLGDIVAGSNRNFSFSLRQAPDGYFVDNDFNQPVLNTGNDTSTTGTFAARTTGTQTIDTGTITFTKRSDSPSGNVVNTASNVLLAKFDVKAAGEAMKVENLRVRVDENNDDTAFTLRNGALYVDGTQVGSTTALAADTDSTLAYTEYTFGSSFIVNPGVTRVLEVKADVFDNDGANGVAAADTLQIELAIGSSNVQRMVSLGYVNGPAAAVEANTVTVQTGSLTVAKDTSLANHTVVAPKFGYKIGQYSMQQTTTEGANITSVVVDLDNSVTGVFDGSDDITNLYIVMGSYTSPIKATVTDTANTFSTNVTIAAGQNMALSVYGDIAASATDGAGAADALASSVTVSSTTLLSSTTATATEVAGQVITAGAGTFATAVAPDTPVNRIAYGNQEVEAARFKITATNEQYTLKEWRVTVASATVASAVVEARLYSGSTLLGSAPFSLSTNTAALITGLETKAEAVIAANTNRTYSVKLMLNQIGGNFGTSQQNVVVTLDSVLRLDSQGVQATDGTDRVGNEVYVYKSIPKLEFVDLTNSTLTNGSAQDVYKFKVTGQGAAVVVKQIKLSTSWSDGGTADTLEVESLKVFKNDVDITSSTTMVDQAGNVVTGTAGLLEDDTTLVITWTTEDSVAAAETATYRVRGTPQGFRLTGTDTVGDSVAINAPTDAAHNGTSVFLNDETDIAAGQSEIMELFTSAAANTSDGTAANFIWSDISSTAHASAANASSTGDWANGYNVLNLPLDGETWSK